MKNSLILLLACLLVFVVPLQAQHKTVTLATTDLTANEVDTIAKGGYDIGKNFDLFGFWVSSDSTAAVDIYIDYQNGTSGWATVTDSLVTTATVGAGREIVGRNYVSSNIGFSADKIKRIRASKRASGNAGASKTLTIKIAGIKVRNQ